MQAPDAARRVWLQGRRRLAVAAGVTVAVLATGLGACDASKPGPDAAAASFAAALSSGDFTSAPVAGATAADAAAQRTAVFEGLAPRQPAVTVTTIDTAKDTPDAATATLAYTWDVDASETDWTYTTTVSMTRVDGAWHATWTPFVLAPDLVAGEKLAVTRVPAPRASVLGADDVVLVEDRDVVHIGLDKTRVDAASQDGAARALATQLALDADAFAGRVAAAGAKAFVEALTVRANDPSYDVAALRALPGVNLVPGTLPLAPSRRFARPILGAVGPATAEIVDASHGAIAVGDLTGLSGLQRQYDAQLRGLPGLTIAAVNSATTASRTLFTSEPSPGVPLTLTLDAHLQDAAEQILDGVGPASAIVAIRPSTGDVLVAASGPGGGGLSTATIGKYAPGSTFKVVSSLALLRAGLTPDSPVTCPATVTVDGREFANFPGYPTARLGDITLRDAVANSCNTAFIGQRDVAPQSALADAAASLGLGGDGVLGFPAYLGSVPATAEGTDHAASMIGQARVEASPLAMATVAASIAHGAQVSPRLVVPAAGASSIAPPDPDATSTPSASASARVATPLTEPEAAALREMMRAVVTEGSGGFLLDVPGAEVLAKSGTAQFGPQDGLKNHAWMIAIQGDLAVAVFVDEGDFGSTTAGPLLRQFLQVAST